MAVLSEAIYFATLTGLLTKIITDSLSFCSGRGNFLHWNDCVARIFSRQQKASKGVIPQDVQFFHAVIIACLFIRFISKETLIIPLEANSS